MIDNGENLGKKRVEDFYTNSISVVANSMECLIRLYRDTPSETDSSDIDTEHLANVRMSLPLAESLVEVLNKTLDEVKQKQQGAIEN